MNPGAAAGLGVVQALTELLPVSSSGHLRLAHDLFDLHVDDSLLFDILLHVGTLVAVVAVYRQTLGRMTLDALQGLPKLRHGLRSALEQSEGLRFVMLVVLATLPTGVMGVLLGDVLSSDAIGAPIVGGLLLLNGAILWSSKYIDREPATDRALSIAGIGPREALIIGVAQGIAILPGISRAGMTIVTALLLGAERMKAAEFSFVLSIPAILGATVLEFDPDALSAGSGEQVAYVVGGITAAVVGVLALKLLLRLLRGARFHQFAWYCWAVGATALVWSLAS